MSAPTMTSQLDEALGRVEPGRRHRARRQRCLERHRPDPGQPRRPAGSGGRLSARHRPRPARTRSPAPTTRRCCSTRAASARPRAEIDAALALDPSFHFGYTALGRYYLQTGETDKGLREPSRRLRRRSGLRARAARARHRLLPERRRRARHAAARRRRAARSERSGRVAGAHGHRARPVRSGHRRSLSARDALAKIRARGGYYSPLAAARDAGSFLADSFRLLELNAWGRYYGDAVFNPFTATGYFDQAINLTPNPFFDADPLTTPISGEEASPLAFSSLLQGLLLDPLAIASRNRRTDLVRRPFLDTEIGGGFVGRDGELGWTASAEVQGFSNLPVPTSFYLSLAGIDTTGDRANDERQR